MKAVIVDDEQMSRQTLFKLLELYCPQVEVLGEAESAEDAFLLINQKSPDVVFLDVEMPFGSGFDLLARFSEIDFEVIFVTAFDQYALKAIRSSALDYLLKPINAEELMEAVKKMEEKKRTITDKLNVEKLLRNLKQLDANNNQIVVPTSDGFEFVEIDEIIRFEAEGRYTRIFLNGGGKILICKNLKEFESLLEGHNFFRTHHSHLVNMKYVKQYSKLDGGFLKMKEGSTVPISRRKKDAFLKRFS